MCVYHVRTEADNVVKQGFEKSEIERNKFSTSTISDSNARACHLGILSTSRPFAPLVANAEVPVLSCILSMRRDYVPSSG